MVSFNANVKFEADMVTKEHGHIVETPTEAPPTEVPTETATTEVSTETPTAEVATVTPTVTAIPND